ncbi:MAG: SO_0444 family Cu/Zn efflux transporter [Prevotella sp.]|nr:SO_0444 family Cu/Zn efflux transporter [Prevotella sp.]
MLNEIIHLLNEMSPYLLLGFFIAGIMHAFIPGRLYSKYLSKNSIRSVINAALLGIPLPLCSCGVIPTAMSLRKEGASKGAVVSFLIATPQTGVDSIVATYSLMGLPFAIIRPIVALFTALFGGQLVNQVVKCDNEGSANGEYDSAEDHCCCHHEEPKHDEEHCCCHHEEPKHEDEHCCCHHEESHCCCHNESDKEKKGFFQKMGVALRYAFVDMIDDIGKWLVIGIVIAAIITVAVPDDWFAIFKDNTWLSIILVLAISIPMYVCATGSIPIAVALMLKGLTPGAGLVLLMAGPAANMASILIIRHRLGWKTLAAYLISIIGGAVAAAAVIDYLLPRSWFTTALQQYSCCEESGTPVQWICTVVLTLLLLYAAYNHYIRKKPSGCHCSE